MKVTCVFCSNNVEVPITEEQYEKIINRDDLIQNVVPELSPEFREMFISGMCPDCWKEMFL